MLRRHVNFALASTTALRFCSSSPQQQNHGENTTYRVERAVIPLSERFGKGLGGIAKPEVPSTIRAHPLNFDVCHRGRTLKIKWKVVPLGPAETKELAAHMVAHRLLPPGADSDPNFTLPTDARIDTTVSAELMRVCAPSTDVLSMPANLVVGAKKGVAISDIHLVGNYAIRVTFSDGHTAGIFGYQYLFDLSGPEKWARSRMYLDTLRKSKRSRLPAKAKPVGGVVGPAAAAMAASKAKKQEQQQQLQQQS